MTTQSIAMHNAGTPLVIPTKVMELAEKIYIETGISKKNLMQLDAGDLSILADRTEGLKNACSIFDYKELIQLDIVDLYVFIDFCGTLNEEQLSIIRSLRLIFNLSLDEWLKIFPEQVIDSKLECFIKHSKFIINLFELRCSLEEVIDSLNEIKNNGYFANILLENFKLLCKISNLSPIQILKIEPRRFIYLLTKVKDIENQLKAGILQPFEVFLNLPLEEMKRILPYTSEELSSFFHRKVVKVCPDSLKEIRRLAYNICPCNVTVATSSNIIGGARKPILNLMMFALNNEMSTNAHAYDKTQLDKLENLHSLLTFAQVIETVYGRIRVSKERWKWKDRIEARKEIATQFLIAKLKDQKSQNTEYAKLIFPGGWCNHAVIYGISLDTFSVWNTGGGLERHHKRNSKDEAESETVVSDSNNTNDQYQIRAKWSNLLFEQVSKASFLESLLEDGAEDLIGDPNRTYQKIIDHFGKDQDPMDEDSSSFHHAQKYKNCGWESLWAASADLLGRKENPLLALRVKSVIIETLRRFVLDSISQEDKINIDEILIQAAEVKEEKIKRKVSILTII